MKEAELKALIEKVCNEAWHRNSPGKAEEIKRTISDIVNEFGGPEKLAELAPFDLYDASHTGEGARRIRVETIKEWLEGDVDSYTRLIFAKTYLLIGAGKLYANT